jgi:hypothetical protein
MDRNDHRAWQGDENPQTNGEVESMQNGLADGIRQMLNAKNESGETFSSISVQIAEQKMFQVLVRQMWMVDFETKKGVAELFWQCLKAPCPGGFTFAYVMEHYDDVGLHPSLSAPPLSSPPSPPSNLPLPLFLSPASPCFHSACFDHDYDVVIVVVRVVVVVVVVVVMMMMISRVDSRPTVADCGCPLARLQED